jgi:type IX secretion system PorP/SprF family membrane protein
MFCMEAEAQYLPNSSQAFQFASVYNPAFTGVENYGDLKLGYRYQWTGFGNNAPKFINIVYNIRLNQQLDLKRNSLRTSVSDDKLPVNKRMIHGLGVSLFNEDVGVINRIGGGINYSLHYPLIKSIWMATGLSVGIENTRVDINEIYMGTNPDPDPFYERLLSNGANRTDLNVRAGVLFYSPIFYLGFCYLPVLNTPLQTSEGNFADPFYRGTVQTGVSIPLSQDFNLKPSIHGVWQMDNELLFDYSVKVFYRERIWLGATYRDTKSGVGLIGLNLNKLLVATYSYEIPTSALRQFSDGSHELVLAIRLSNSRGYNPYTW